MYKEILFKDNTYTVLTIEEIENRYHSQAKQNNAILSECVREYCKFFAFELRYHKGISQLEMDQFLCKIMLYYELFTDRLTLGLVFERKTHQFRYVLEKYHPFIETLGNDYIQINQTKIKKDISNYSPADIAILSNYITTALIVILANETDYILEQEKEEGILDFHKYWFAGEHKSYEGLESLETKKWLGASLKAFIDAQAELYFIKNKEIQEGISSPIPASYFTGRKLRKEDFSNSNTDGQDKGKYKKEDENKYFEEVKIPKIDDFDFLDGKTPETKDAKSVKKIKTNIDKNLKEISDFKEHLDKWFKEEKRKL